MLDGIEIRGVGMHPFGRFPEKGLKDLGRVAAIEAINDAGLGVKDIDGVYVANALGGVLTGQEQIRGQTIVRDIGIEGVPIVNVENACAGGSTALREAVLAVRAGAADTVLALGVEKMFVGDTTRTLDALRSAADLDVVAGLGLQFTAIYAMRLRARLDDGSITIDDLADIAVKSHAMGALNPYAQHQATVTPEEVLASRPIAEPLTLLMCSSVCDGAAVVVVQRSGAADPDGRPRVAVRASQLRSGRTASPDGDVVVSAVECATAAYEESGFGPDDLDVLEVHDAMAPGELFYYEHLGLCGYGEAAKLLRTGVTKLGGRHVVNPSGGLSSRGHPVGATGLAQVAEIVWQLRGEAGPRQVADARVGLAQNSGGWVEGDSAACNVHVFERLDA
ncbi:MAG: thiolase family protein [Actinobacteria bacterium]|nr:thiolase family protein [Actinomycetota bacterium]